MRRHKENVIAQVYTQSVWTSQVRLPDWVIRDRSRRGNSAMRFRSTRKGDTDLLIIRQPLLQLRPSPPP